ncbi:PREDICTED: cytochrome P450 6B1-like [Eufriesea mexicana]|uniref:cytochrome P450 6B1-like n=1 Tax=Eufriesea mexicana TaxID=516756 RepID=UPI00083C1E34|nr:PREDICTED: cytochrome P450 6B1-like [Eufriesea mexicana]
MADYLQILGVLVALLLALYYYLGSSFDYWKNRGVVGPKPIPIFGNVKDVLLRKINLGDYVAQIYNEYKDEIMIGIFARVTPTVILRDMDLIKDVLIKDFSSFDDRGSNVFERSDPLTANLFNLEPERWRPLRMRLSPVFTSGKLKDMFPLILECAEHLEQCLDKVAEKSEPIIECREIAARYSTDVIGNCAFGINMNTLENERSEFRRIGRKIFDQDFILALRFTLRESAPGIYGLLSYLLPQTEITTFLTKVISDTIKYREENNVVRPDFINMLMELKKHPDKLENIDLTDTLLTAQAFIFFAAGFETSSTTIGHALYELALNPSIQDKLREEMKEFSTKNNGNLTYNVVKDMKYLDKVFKETLRKYPPAMFLRRKCNGNYTFSGTKVTITKGTKLIIPVYGIQKDPNIYPNPDVFDPERFNEDAEAARHPMSFLPFGDGPRNCIGARFALYQTKIGLIKMLENFRIDVCEKTMTSYVNNPKSLTLAPMGGIHLKISKVEKLLL